MSQIALKTFLTFKPNAKSVMGYEFFPSPSNVEKVEDQLVVTLGDVPFPDGIPHAAGALTVLYGFKDSLDEMQKQYGRARESGMSVVAVLSDFEVGASAVRITSFEDLSETKFINLKRCASLLQETIVDGVNELVASEKGKSQLFDKWSDLGRRPDLLCNFLRSDSRFTHVSAVAYNLPSDGSSGRMVVSIFSPEDCTFVVRGQCPFKIQLPRFSL